MNTEESKTLSKNLILSLKGLQSGRMTLIVSSSSNLNEDLISTILKNDILSIKQIKQISSYSGSFEKLFSESMDEKRTKGLDILAVSDIQFFQVDDQISNHEHMTKLSWNFKYLSKELKCHVIVGLSVESFSNDQMTFKKLKEVGQLDVDSDAILFIDSENNKINIVKNRLGELSKFIK